MRPPVLMDAGPMVALFSADDQYHEATVALLTDLAPPLVTCWPVITEAAWRLRGRPDWVDALLDACAGGLFHPVPMLSSDIPVIRSLMSTYRSLQLQLADACLLVLADRLNAEQIVSFDRRDFSVAHTPGHRLLRIIPDA